MQQQRLGCLGSVRKSTDESYYELNWIGMIELNVGFLLYSIADTNIVYVYNGYIEFTNLYSNYRRFFFY